jgi:RNA polymerase sigma-70 factor, ECF subfamily
VTDTHNSTVQLKQKAAGRLPAQMTTAELNDLFAECIPRLRKVARRMFRNDQDSEDALQEALLLAFRKIHQFQGRSSFSTWMHSIVRNTSYAYYRKNSSHLTEQFNPGDEDGMEERPFIDGRPTPEENYAQMERAEIFREAAGELPEKYQPAVYLFYLRGLGEKATAKALGITVGALKSHLHRSRVLLLWRIWKRCWPEVKRAGRCKRPPMHTRPWVQARNRVTHCKSQRELGMLQ